MSATGPSLGWAKGFVVLIGWVQLTCPKLNQSLCEEEWLRVVVG